MSLNILSSAEELEQTGQKLEAKVYSTLQQQVAQCSTPMFCRCHSDPVSHESTCVSLPFRSGRCSPASARVPWTCWRPSKASPAFSAPPSTRCPTWGSPPATPCASSSTRAAPRVERRLSPRDTAGLHSVLMLSARLHRAREGRVGPLRQELPAHLLQRVQPAAPCWRVKHLQDGSSGHH